MHTLRLAAPVLGLSLGLWSVSVVAQASPAFDVAQYVSVDDERAQVRAEFDVSEGDTPLIEVLAPGSATVTFSGANAGGSAFARGPSQAEFLPVGTDPEGDVPADIHYTADGSEYLVLHRVSNNIIRFDAATNEPTGSIELDDLAVAFDITPDGRAVVGDYLADSVTIIDLASNARTTIPVGDAPGFVEVSPDGRFAVVGCVTVPAFYIIDLQTDAIARVIPAPGFAVLTAFSVETGTVDTRVTSDLAWVDDETFLFAAQFDDLLARVNVASGLRIDIPVATDPARVDVSGDGSRAIVGHNTQPGIVTLVDTATNAVLNVFNNPTRTTGPVAINQPGTRAVVAFQNLTRSLNLTTGAFSANLNTSNLVELITNADRTRAIGVGFSGAVIDLNTGALLARANDRVSCPIGVASPTADRAVLASTTFGDDIVVLDTDTSPGTISFRRSGPDPEGDIARSSDVAPDGSRFVAANVNSDNLTIFDTASRSITGYATLDQRPGEVEIAPDSSKAVAVNLDAFNVSVVDLDTAATTPVSAPRRASQVEIAPDGSAAYIAVLAGTDGVHRLDLTTNTLGPVTPTGNMGGVGYSFSQVSQIALSPDGSLLAVAGSFSDSISIIEAATMTLTQTLAAGDFPTRLAWNQAGDRLYVSDRDTDRVFLFAQAGGFVVPAFPASITVGDQPFDIIPLPNSGVFFVLNWGEESVSAVNTNTGLVLATIPLPYRPMGAVLSDDASRLIVAGGLASTSIGAGVITSTREGEATVIDTQTFQVVDRINTGFAAADARASDDASVVSIASPGSDGVILLADAVCLADVNGDGQLTGADFNAWLGAFSNGDPRADQNLDGQLNGADFNAWLGNFSAGCP